MMFGDAYAPILVIAEQVASLARELGRNGAAIRRAADRLQRQFAYTWTQVGSDTILLTARSGRACVYSHQEATSNGYRLLVKIADASVDDGPGAPVERLPYPILPAGEHPFPKIKEELQHIAKEDPGARFDWTRLDKINGLGPSSHYRGVDEFEGYCAVWFADEI
jgi:hypothetical protein